MRLDEKEFRAMNNPGRRLLQRSFEYPVFRHFGLVEREKDILEIGCGSGYGGVLLSGLAPKSYVGIDVMPEQIDLAKRYNLQNSSFFVMDVADLSAFESRSKDIIVDFGILHHVERWERALEECYRVLRVGGRIFMEEPSTALLGWWDRIFGWNHPREAMFDLARFEEKLDELGFIITYRMNLLVWGMYAARKL